MADIVATVPPLKMILEPIVAGRMTVASLVPPGASPHTFTLRPSDASQLNAARAVFYVDESLDGWAAKLAPENTHNVMSLVPPAMRIPYDFDHGHAHDHVGEGENANPHFWSDPRTVASIVPRLVELLTAVDPAGKPTYEANGRAFVERLTELDAALEKDGATWPPVKLVAFHPSWSYFFQRYNIPVAAYVEPVPGKELTPKTILALRGQLAGPEPVIILSEVQLPERSANALAEALGARVTKIDPLGGLPPLDEYTALINANAGRIREALP